MKKIILTLFIFVIFTLHQVSPVSARVSPHITNQKSNKYSLQKKDKSYTKEKYQRERKIRKNESIDLPTGSALDDMYRRGFVFGYNLHQKWETKNTN